MSKEQPRAGGKASGRAGAKRKAGMRAARRRSRSERRRAREEGGRPAPTNALVWVTEVRTRGTNGRNGPEPKAAAGSRQGRRRDTRPSIARAAEELTSVLSAERPSAFGPSAAWQAQAATTAIMRVSVNKVLASNKDALERWMASQGCAEFARRCASAFPNLTAAERAMLEEAARQTPDELLQSAREKVRQDEALKRWFARELVLAAKSAAAGPHREAKAPHQVALKTWASHNPVWAVVAAGVAVESKKHQFDGR
jgi:hypothetical protein